MFHSVDGGWSEGNKFYFVLLENKEDIQRHTVTWFGNDKRLETKEDGLKIGYASHDGNKKVLWKNYAVITIRNGVRVAVLLSIFTGLRKWYVNITMFHLQQFEQSHQIWRISNFVIKRKLFIFIP